MEESKNVKALLDLQKYTRERILMQKRSPHLDDVHILALLELELPYLKLGFDSFQEFLSSLDIKTLFPDENVLCIPRTVSELGPLDNLKYDDRVVWFPISANETHFRGKVNWIGSVNNMVFVGVEFNKGTGLGPFFWKECLLFDCTPGHGKLVQLHELLLEKDYDANSKTLFGKLADNVNSVFQSIGEGFDSLVSSILPTSAESRADNGNNNELTEFHPQSVYALPNGLKVGDLVVWVTEHGNQDGVLAWIGYLRLHGGLFAGVDFQRGVGDTDGTYMFHKLFDCARGHGKFVRVSELRNYEDFYKMEVEMKIGKSNSNEESQLLDTTEKTNQGFEIGERVAFQSVEDQLWTGIIVWKSSGTGTSNEDVLYGIDFDKPTGLTSNGELALPFQCRSGHGGLAPQKRIVKLNQQDFVPITPLTSSVIELSSGVNGCSRNEPGNSLCDFIEPFVDQDRWINSLGTYRGIQGEDNSCYVDSTLFLLLAYNDIFDKFLIKDVVSQDDGVRKLKKILREQITNPLRTNYFCPAGNIKVLRKEIAKLNSNVTYGRMANVEELLYVLCEAGLKLDNFIHYSNGVSDYIHQTIINPKDQAQIISTQRLIEISLLMEGNVKFNRVPTPALFMMLPRSEGRFVKYEMVIPSLILDLTHLMSDSQRPCILCNSSLATSECLECFDQICNSGIKSTAFCNTCFELFHRDNSRKEHYKTVKPVQFSEAAVPKEKYELQLLGVVCFKNLHYISYVKCGLDKFAPWVRHDSMAEFGIPEVKPVPGLGEFLERIEFETLEKVQKEWDTYIPEVKELLTESHLCVYCPTFVET